MRKKISFGTAAMISVAIASTSLTSCVKNDVSPQVEKLREAQVAWVAAKTATETALTDYQKAQTTLTLASAKVQEAIAAQTAQKVDDAAKTTAFTEATRVFLLQKAKADNDKDLVVAQQQLADAQANLKV